MFTFLYLSYKILFTFHIVDFGTSILLRVASIAYLIKPHKPSKYSKAVHVPLFKWAHCRQTVGISVQHKTDLFFLLFFFHVGKWLGRN